MTRKTGSQVSTFDILAGKANEYTGLAELFGETVLLINGTIMKRDFQRAAQAKLGVTDRQARALTNSYVTRGPTEVPAGTQPRINDRLAVVSSAGWELMELADRADDARRENGAKGGRRLMRG